MAVVRGEGGDGRLRNSPPPSSFLLGHAFSLGSGKPIIGEERKETPFLRLEREYIYKEEREKVSFF